MKIASAEMQMESTHAAVQQRSTSESLRVWIGDRRADLDAAQGGPAIPSAPVSLSPAARATQSGQADAIDQAVDAALDDPMLRLLLAMIALLTGREAKVFDARSLEAPTTEAAAVSAPATPAAASAGFGIEYDRRETYDEIEQTNFQASGTIRTSDGREIAFTLDLAMARSFHFESTTSLRAGDARKTQDPLVINFSGTSAQLTSRRFRFDLDADGQDSEEINFVTGGSGFLAIDRNADGKIGNGSELFGALSGNGFADLAALDADGNGWIDESDPAYAQLLVWTKDAEGSDRLVSLDEAGVGALALAHAATPFSLTEADNSLQAVIRETGVFLQENGKAGTIQQVDLTV